MWLFDEPLVMDVGSQPITSLLDVGYDMWVACGKHVHVVTVMPADDEEHPKKHREDFIKVGDLPYFIFVSSYKTLTLFCECILV